MPQTEFVEYPHQYKTIFVHFDVVDHHIELETFLGTAIGARNVVEALNTAVFGGGLEFQIVVLPAQEGTFLQSLKIVIPALVGLVVFLDSDTPAAFVRGLTGKSPSEWAYQAGISTLELIEITAKKAEGAETDTNGRFSESVDFALNERICEAGARMLAAMTRASLEKETDEIISLGDGKIEINEILEARANFYRACVFDREIRRIGFTPFSDFPVPRSAFPGRAQRPAKRDSEGDEGTWHTAIEEVSVSSPNWDKEDQHSRQWKGKDVFNRTCYFVIDDEVFWELADRKHLQVGVLDTLKVQWIYQTLEGKAKNRQVLRVLAINGEMLSPAMSLEAVIEILRERSATLGREGGPTLFDDLDDWDK